MRNAAMQIPLVLVLFVPSSTTQQATEGAAARAGALGLTWNEAGRIVRVGVGADDVTGPRVAGSGIALRDFAAQETYEAISGELTATAEDVRIEGRNTAETLAVSVTCVAGHHGECALGTVSP